jgi:hypothetical protein
MDTMGRGRLPGNHRISPELNGQKTPRRKVGGDLTSAAGPSCHKDPAGYRIWASKRFFWHVVLGKRAGSESYPQFVRVRNNEVGVSAIGPG